MLWARLPTAKQALSLRPAGYGTEPLCVSALRVTILRAALHTLALRSASAILHASARFAINETMQPRSVCTVGESVPRGVRPPLLRALRSATEAKEAALRTLASRSALCAPRPCKRTPCGATASNVPRFALHIRGKEE